MTARNLLAGFPIAALLMASSSLPTGPATRAADDEPAKLPGKGLAQHDFLYTGEWDTRKDQATLFLVKGGKVVWTYQIPRQELQR
jgi:hypothetical protein